MKKARMNGRRESFRECRRRMRKGRRIIRGSRRRMVEYEKDCWEGRGRMT